MGEVPVPTLKLLVKKNRSGGRADVMVLGKGGVINFFFIRSIDFLCVKNGVHDNVFSRRAKWWAATLSACVCARKANRTHQPHTPFA